MTSISSRLKAVSKQSAILASGGVAAVAGTADAGVLMFPDCDPSLTCTEVNLNIGPGEKGFFDLNGDGIDDYKISIESHGLGEIATIEGSGKITPAGKIRSSVLTQVTPKGKTVFVQKFESGDKVQGPVLVFDDNGAFYEENVIGTFGPFAAEGTRGYVGLFIETFPFEEEEALIGAVEDVQAVEEESFINFGWLEVVRGSINTVRIGFQSTPGAAAPIPGPVDVPEPATLPLMALGAAGLLAMRRKLTAA